MNLADRPDVPIARPCHHSLDDGNPCDRCPDTPTPVPTAVGNTNRARLDGRCPCGRLITRGDLVCRDLTTAKVICATCTAHAKGRPNPTTPGARP